MISVATQKLFDEMNYLTFSERIAAWNIVIKTYLVLDNNIKQNDKFPILFSRHYIPLIVKISQLNSPFLEEDAVIKIAVSSILNQNKMNNYSLVNNFNHLNSALIFLKLLFKRLYPSEYTILMSKMISFDQLFLKAILNSYADIFDSINLNMYLDFKNLMKNIFISQE